MNYADMMFGSIESEVRVRYKNELDKLNVDPLKKHEELAIYTAFIHNEYQVMKDYIRTRLKENHIAQYEEAQFLAYSKELTEKLLNDACISMTNNWYSAFSVSLENNTKSLEVILPELKINLAKILAKAYTISKEKEHEASKIASEFETELNRLLVEVKQGTIT